MFKAFCFSICFTFTTGAIAQDTPKFDEVQEMLWTRQFVKIYKQSKNSDDLLESLPSLTAFDLQNLKAILGSAQSLPQIETRHRELIFGSKMNLKIISLNDRTFSIDGKRFTYDAKSSLISNFMRIQNLINKKKVTSFGFLLPEAHAEPYDSKLANSWYRDPAKLIENGGSTAYEVFITWAGRAGFIASAVRGANMLYGTLAVHEIVAHAESVLAPACSVQIAELRNILQANRLTVAGMDCDRTVELAEQAEANLKSAQATSVRQQLDHFKYQWSKDQDALKEKGRTISFWTDSKTKKTFNADWVNGVVWDDPNRLFVFNKEGLKEYRVLTTNSEAKPGESNDSILSQFKPGEQEFEKQKKYIEPYRKVFEYMGNNKTCYKCQDEVLKTLVAQEGPKAKSSSASSSAPAAKPAATTTNQNIKPVK